MARALPICLIALVVLLISSVPANSPALTVEAASGALESSALLAFDDQPVEQQVSGIARGALRVLRRALRTVGWMLLRALDLWNTWLRLAAFSLGVAVVAALADGGLVNAWRAEGLGALLRYSALMLYVYTRLLFSSGVNVAPKVLLVGALIYGVVRRDFVPDGSLVPGRVEDIVLIVVATRVFVYACPEELVNVYAERAVNLTRRVWSSQRARMR